MATWNHLGEIFMATAGMMPSPPGLVSRLKSIRPITAGSFDPAYVPDSWQTLVSS